MSIKVSKKVRNKEAKSPKNKKNALKPIFFAKKFGSIKKTCYLCTRKTGDMVP